MRYAWMLSLALLTAACGKAKSDSTRDTDGKPNGLSLTIPESEWQASAFCGKASPPQPIDPTPAYHFDHELLQGKLDGDGLTGWMHGAVPSYGQYVFTYRKEDPSDFMAFFKAEQLALIPANDRVAQLLPTLHRHDKVRLHGKVFANGSPLTHLSVSDVEVLQRYADATDNRYAFDLTTLHGQERFAVFGIVHATVESEMFGRALIVEHNDLMLPLAVPTRHADAAAPIYRGDIVQVAARVVPHEQGPPHFEVDGDVADAIRVVDPMLNCHGQEREVDGFLVKFNKSPAISTDVYAVRVVDANGIARNFTLFPATQDETRFQEVFTALKGKAERAWDASPEAPTVVRNFWKKASVRVRAKGRLNVVSSEQANAQIYMQSADDLTITP